MYKLVTCFDKLGHVVFGKKKKNGETLYYLTNGNGAFAPIKRSDVLLHQSEIENVKVVGNKIIPFNVKPQVEGFLFNNRFNDVPIQNLHYLAFLYMNRSINAISVIKISGAKINRYGLVVILNIINCAPKSIYQ